MITQRQLHLLKEKVEAKHNIKLDIISSDNKCHKLVCNDKVLANGRNIVLHSYLNNMLLDIEPTNVNEIQIVNIIAFCKTNNINVTITCSTIFTINTTRKEFRIDDKHFNTLPELIKYMKLNYRYDKRIKYNSDI